MSDVPEKEEQTDSQTPEQAAAPADSAGRTPDAEIQDLKDKLLRALAEQENLRRRAEREKTEASQYGMTKFARDMVGVADNLRRALDAIGGDARAGASDAIKGLIEGIEATERELLQAFGRHGIKPIEAQGAKFDANLHQAMFEVPGTGQPNGTVVQVVQTGFVIGDRLLRAALVGVAKGEPAAAPPADPAPAQAPAPAPAAAVSEDPPQETAPAYKPGGQAKPGQPDSGKRLDTSA